MWLQCAKDVWSIRVVCLWLCKKQPRPTRCLVSKGCVCWSGQCVCRCTKKQPRPTRWRLVSKGCANRLSKIHITYMVLMAFDCMRSHKHRRQSKRQRHGTRSWVEGGLELSSSRVHKGENTHLLSSTGGCCMRPAGKKKRKKKTVWAQCGCTFCPQPEHRAGTHTRTAHSLSTVRVHFLPTAWAQSGYPYTHGTQSEHSEGALSPAAWAQRGCLHTHDTQS